MSGARAGCMEEASHNWLLSEPWHEGLEWPRWGREACGSWGWWFSVLMLLWLSDASLRVFENMHKDQLDEMVTEASQ